MLLLINRVVMTHKTTVLKTALKVSILSVALCGVSAQAGLFSWLFGDNQNTTTTETRRVVVRTETEATPDTQAHFGQGADAHGHDHSQDFSFGGERNVGTEQDYQMWLGQSPYNRQQATNYQNYLIQQLGKDNVPPMRELLTTARSWQKCGFDPYQVPPSELWHQMVPTIRLYNNLKAQGVLPAHTQIRSVYRSPELNRCAGGAAGSKHLTNGAMDIWIPDYAANSWQMNNTQDKLCQFWIDNGANANFGLGIYSTGAIHLDTQGYRKWGGQFTSAGSPCRYVAPKPEMLYIDGQGWAPQQTQGD